MKEMSSCELFKLSERSSSLSCLSSSSNPTTNIKEISRRRIKVKSSLKDQVVFNENQGGRDHRVPTPLPLPLYVAKAGRNNLNEEMSPPPSPLGLASDVAKPYQI
jgi:hypothetical protein